MTFYKDLCIDQYCLSTYNCKIILLIIMMIMKFDKWWWNCCESHFPPLALHDLRLVVTVWCLYLRLFCVIWEISYCFYFMLFLLWDVCLCCNTSWVDLLWIVGPRMDVKEGVTPRSVQSMYNPWLLGAPGLQQKVLSCRCVVVGQSDYY